MTVLPWSPGFDPLAPIPCRAMPTTSAGLPRCLRPPVAVLRERQRPEAGAGGRRDRVGKGRNGRRQRRLAQSGGGIIGRREKDVNLTRHLDGTGRLVLV